MSEAYSVYAELAAAQVTEDAVEQLFDALAEHSPSVSHAPNGNLSVRVFVEAGNVEAALPAGLNTIKSAARELQIPDAVAGVEIITEGELDRRLTEPPVPPLAGISEIADLGGFSRQRAKVVAERKDFPDPVDNLAGGPIFIKEQVTRFFATWKRTVGRPPKPVDLTPLEKTVLQALALHLEPAPNHQKLADIAATNSALPGTPEDLTSLLNALTDDLVQTLDVARRRLRVRLSPTEQHRPRLLDTLESLTAKKLLNTHSGLAIDNSAPADIVVTVTDKGHRHSQADLPAKPEGGPEVPCGEPFRKA
ncbi:hypothetical protein [Streptomyces nanshensis]|uniref:DNA-binding protein n=1 Tax=Streptomyces nanshensis TaxID=518642 RepID=A0A1E7L8R5_9ACTN|nr:hypothetical protein [Streptomyces nanshensis]OEV12587.1 hypothetical protein AN218_07640 [Streptomyces nanshensis]